MNESLCSAERLVSKANEKESYRLWFEFLKRAMNDSTVKLDKGKYTAWGDYAMLSFDSWWRQIGSAATSLEQQTFIEVVTKIPKNSTDLFIRIPAAVTTTQAVNQLRAILSGAKRKATALETALRIREGAEIRHAAFRAYLVTYDAHQVLSRNCNGKRVSGDDLLREVRKLYSERTVKFMARVNAGQRVDELPPSLYGKKGASLRVIRFDDAQAIAAVQRYLKKANEIIGNVAEGRFPD